MDFISSNQYDKYKDILDKIDEEFKKQEDLKKQLESEGSKLTAVRVAAENFLLRKQVFHAFVKVYNSIFDVSFVYSDLISRAELAALLGYCNSKFYVVELTMSSYLLQKLATQKFLLHVNVSNSISSVHKTVAICKRSCPFIVVVPFGTSTEQALVNTFLYVNQGETWCALHKSSTTVDFSYHFSTTERSWNDDSILKVAQCYHMDLKDKFKNKQVEYKFKCKCNVKHFFESIVKHCYHRLNPETFAVFANRDASSLSMCFTVDGDNKVVVKLDRLQNVLSVTCNVYDLMCVKKYFVSEMRCEEASVDKMWLVALTNLKQYLRAELGEPQIQYKDVLIIYEELQKLIYELSV